MTKEQYKKLRAELTEAAEGLINDGKLEDAQAKMGEVEELDNQFEKIKVANANLAALKDKSQVTNYREQIRQRGRSHSGGINKSISPTLTRRGLQKRMGQTNDEQVFER